MIESNHTFGVGHWDMLDTGTDMLSISSIVATVCIYEFHWVCEMRDLM